jgi:hypothetical protein
MKTWFKYSSFSTLQRLPKGKTVGFHLFFIFKVEWKDKFLIAIKRMKITSIFTSPLRMIYFLFFIPHVLAFFSYDIFITKVVQITDYSFAFEF